jgi:uncharacterized protein (TIGR00255 family)
MLASMTAFTSKALETKWGTLSGELRSVNHRYLDLMIRLPDNFRVLEAGVREQLKSRLQRGRVECVLKLNSQSGEAALHINAHRLSALMTVVDEVSVRIGSDHTPDVMALLQWPGIVELPVVDATLLEKSVQSLLSDMLDEFCVARKREGQQLAQVIQQRLESLTCLVQAEQQRLPDILRQQQEKLQKRVSALDVNLDPQRFSQEVALLAQRIDVTEELDRLLIHLAEVARQLEEGNPVGRRLDFLMQELNREANTLGSKSVDALTTKTSVDCKVLIEQMREQVQNLE